VVKVWVEKGYEERRGEVQRTREEADGVCDCLQLLMLAKVRPVSLSVQ
jgi:hypothetical protein